MTRDEDEQWLRALTPEEIRPAVEAAAADAFAAPPKIKFERLQRLLKLSAVLCEGEAITQTELASRCGCDLPTMRRDLGTLEQNGLEIIRDGRGANGRVGVSGSVKLKPIELTFGETLLVLILSRELGSGGSGLPGYELLRDTVRKIESAFPVEWTEPLRRLAGLVAVRLPPRSQPERAEAWFARVLQALATRQVITIRYDSLYERKSIETDLSVYRLAYVRRTWYAVGYSSLHQTVRTFHVGRIGVIHAQGTCYQVPEDFSLESHWGAAWSMIPDPDQHRVRIRFTEKVARNVFDVQWHKEQEFRWEEGGSLLFEATVDGLREITYWVLGYGADAEVLAPEELRDAVTDHAARMANSYGVTGAAPDG